MSDALLVQAPAKVNLCLEVLGRRSDGYHEIRTVMQTIDLADELEIAPADSLQVACDDPSLAGDNNLVWHAVTDFAKSCGRLPLVKVSIKKRIPVGMGLGGGSSDAAAVILALNRLWDVGYPFSKLSEIAAGLGSDVPFFLLGGAALASGRGEIVEPLPGRPGIPLTLVCPETTLKAKTARLYAELTPANYSDGGVAQHLLRHIMEGQYSDGLLCNAFEDVALRVFPGLREVYDTVEAVAGRRPHLTGAGPAWFLMPSNEAEHLALSQALQSLGAKAYFVHTTGRTKSFLEPAEAGQ